MENGKIKAICLHIPKIEDLWFRELMLSDEETMSYNHAYGGTIPFPKEIWADWHDKWIAKPKQRFYRYLQKIETGEFIGEVAYHFDEYRFLLSIIIYSKYRGLGYGKDGLNLLCECAKNNGIIELCDDIAIDNPSIKLFIDNGFKEEYRTNQIVMVKKVL